MASPPTSPDRLALRANDYGPYARDLARRGYLSVVVLRRGFGSRTVRCRWP